MKKDRHTGKVGHRSSYSPVNKNFRKALNVRIDVKTGTSNEVREKDFLGTN